MFEFLLVVILTYLLWKKWKDRDPLVMRYKKKLFGPNVVKFDDDTYGIRRYWFFGWWFQDVHTGMYAWRFGTEEFHDYCRARSIEAIKPLLKQKEYTKTYRIIDV